MRIVWPAAYYGTQRGSFVAAMARVAQRAVARGDRFDAVLPDLGPLDWHEELRELGAGVHLVRAYDARAAAVRTLRLRPSVAHAHFDGWLVTLTALLAPTRTRILWHMHQSLEPGGGPLRFTWRRAVKYRVVGPRVARFVAVSEAVAADLARLGAPRGRIVVVPNTVDGSRFHPPAAEERAAARARLGLGTGPAVAFFGRDPVIKGADVLAAALPAATDPVVVAVATPADAVAAIARRGRVVAVPLTDDVRSVLWAVDAVVIPSRGEGMPFVALEALACGVPVVASGLPWALELAAGNPAVRVVPPGDSSALRHALDAMLAAPPPASAGERGDLHAWAQRILALYGAKP